MQIKNSFPPNIDQIRLAGLRPDRGAVFAYGDIIYNPSGGEIPADIIFHENVHAEQQANYTSPDVWWAYYLGDREFRKKQEVEAYYKQWQFVKKHVPKIGDEMVDNYADILSSPMYNLDITKYQALTLIRKYVKSTIE